MFISKIKITKQEEKETKASYPSTLKEKELISNMKILSLTIPKSNQREQEQEQNSNSKRRRHCVYISDIFVFYIVKI